MKSKLSRVFKTGIVLVCSFVVGCATTGSNEKVTGVKLSRDMFYDLQSSGVTEIRCQQKLSDIGTKLIGRALLDPALTGVSLDILKIQTAPEIKLESQQKGLQNEALKNEGSPQERVLHALMAAHVRYYQHVAGNYLPIFYIQNPLDFAKAAVFLKSDDEFVTRYKDAEEQSIEVRVEKDGQYIKILTSPFSGRTDMTLRYGPFENHNILQSIELTCLTSDCRGVERSTTTISYETIEGLPLIKKIAFNIGDGDLHENTTSLFTNLKCLISKKQ